jgi:hypothetical protein
MWLSSWLRNRNAPPAGKSVRTRRSVRKSATFRPRLESLEGRDLPSTLTVTNTLDTGIKGDGSLRGEIAAAAQSGDTIVFDPRTMAGKQILLSGLELYVDKNLTIQGLPTGSVINGAGASRVFDVGVGVSVTLANLTITGGSGIDDLFNAIGSPSDGLGGGILNSGTLTVRNCTVTGNTDLIGGPNFGGGIYNDLGAVLTVTGSTVSGNGNVFGPDHTGSGGGIYNAGTLTIDGSVLSGNVAFDGGGIFNAAGGTLSMTGTTLSGNSADSLGGGLYNTYRATATVMNCTLTGNTAHFFGGGIYNDKYGHLAIGGSTFSNNAPDNIFGSYSDKRGNTFS